LARKARAIRKRESLGSWLHGVALRIALKLRGRRQRTTQREQSTPSFSPESPCKTSADISWRELQEVLDQELERLPEKIRAPLILCYLEGKTRDEAAAHLGWSATTVKGRLERGRELLRGRLARHGLPLGSALGGLALVGPAANAWVPASLAVSTV